MSNVIASGVAAWQSHTWNTHSHFTIFPARDIIINMNTKDSVIAVLKKSRDYVSGEKISETLGLSRMAVNSAVKSLRADGYEITSVTNRGYLLTRSPDIINCGELSAYLPSERTEKVLCLESVDSTNNRLRSLALEGAPAGQIVIAESQTAGRGRYGRSFASPKGKGVYLSALLRPQNVTAASVMSASAWVAAAIHNAVMNAFGVRTGIKWVNDLTLGSKKLCGILTEMSIESENGHIQYMVIGAGVNVNETAEDFPEEYRSVATSLYMHTGVKLSRAKLAAEMIKSLDKLSEDIPFNKQPYLDIYRTYNVTAGKEVRLVSANENSVAYAKAIDDEFGLVVIDKDGNEKTVHSGEASVRGLYGYV
ncbi:biotin--[acetyl-CoA-carboxylase] ligase [Pumilibacter intestinalis]|uniref:biotin--[acetyl-CoA-carboxylase] ligase n=1 Tax=Pumilibacter intestinalis TaxID=2941511 RepID=UPI00203DD21C|nr:biotin--[acetyl-CoA-carboxylase] ligase [Pumilibacter intestinalis]